MLHNNWRKFQLLKLKTFITETYNLKKQCYNRDL
jgi:hypothetical protein